MSRFIDITGTKFGSWTAIEFVGGANGMWKVRCVCGTISAFMGRELRKGRTYQECVNCRRRRGHARPTDEMPEIGIWKDMIRRCTDEASPNYKHYGGRGIRVCDRWLESFENFLIDIGRRPPGKYASGRSLYSIERVGNDGDYEPGNVKWALKSEQVSNTRRNRRLTHAGETKTLAEWARALGWGQKTIQCRLDAGWPVHLALTVMPVRYGAKHVMKRRAA